MGPFPWRRLGAEFGVTEKEFAEKISIDLFRKKIHFTNLMPKTSDDLLVTDSIVLVFCLSLVSTV